MQACLWRWTLLCLKFSSPSPEVVGSRSYLCPSYEFCSYGVGLCPWAIRSNANDIKRLGHDLALALYICLTALIFSRPSHRLSGLFFLSCVSLPLNQSKKQRVSGLNSKVINGKDDWANVGMEECAIWRILGFEHGAVRYMIGLLLIKYLVTGCPLSLLRTLKTSSLPLIIPSQ